MSPPRFALRYLGHRPGASLSYFTGAGVELRAGDIFDVPTDGLLIGRRASADLRIASSSVAPRHARVVAGQDGARVEDLGATNGTEIDGTPLGGRGTVRTLMTGGRLTIAGAFDFELIAR